MLLAKQNCFATTGFAMVLTGAAKVNVNFRPGKTFSFAHRKPITTARMRHWMTSSERFLVTRRSATVLLWVAYGPRFSHEPPLFPQALGSPVRQHTPRWSSVPFALRSVLAPAAQDHWVSGAKLLSWDGESSQELWFMSL